MIILKQFIKITNLPINIICPEHGLFAQSARGMHLRGVGCPLCGAGGYIRKAIYREATKVHSGKYTYENIEYINMKKNINVTCPIHGVFKQRASAHIQGAGCLKCKNMPRITKDEFIERSRKKHGNKYKYDRRTMLIPMQRWRLYAQRGTVLLCKHHSHMSSVLNAVPHMERTINTWLTDNNIIFEQQVRFTDCVDQLQLPFDFCIYNKDGTIKTLLEYDGEQHYKPYRKNQKALTLTQYHDAIKNQYCEDHKIPLIRIPYWDKDKIP